MTRRFRAKKNKEGERKTHSHLHKHLIGALEVYRNCKGKRRKRMLNSEKEDCNKKFGLEE